MGQKTARPTRSLYVAGDGTTAGLRPACSRPTCGFSENHTTSPRSGTQATGYQPSAPCGGASLGALIGIGIWFALMSVTFMYEGRRPALFLIDGGYHVIALTLASAILGAWPPG